VTTVLPRKLAEAGGPTVEFRVHFRNGNRGRRRLCLGNASSPPATEPGNIPRIARLVALAIRFERLLRQGVVRDYADLARLGHVSRPRVSQIMNLLNLAPDIQEEILYLPSIVGGRDPVTERHLRRIAATPDWRTQRRLWRELLPAHSRATQPTSPRCRSVD